MSVPIAALLTPRGRGAVAVIGVRNDGRLIDGASPSVFRAANGLPLASQPVGRIVFGRWGHGAIEPAGVAGVGASPPPAERATGWGLEDSTPATQSASVAAEEIVVCRVAADRFEIHCHGGDAPVDRILRDLARLGARIVGGFEFLATPDDDEWDWSEALSQATTLRTADLLLQQRGGLLRTTLATIIDAAKDAANSGDASALARLDAILAWAEFGRHLVRPWRIVLAGRPNVGKSSLVNALVGYTRSIVFHEPGTTRDVVTAETAFDGWPLLFCDTAGLRDASQSIEAEGVRRTRDALVAADLTLLVLDAGDPPTEDDRRLLRELPAALVVAHKSDRPDAWGREIPADAVRVSSLANAGIDDLLRRIVARLVPHVPPPGTAVPVTERQVAAVRAAREAVLCRSS